MTRKKKQKVGGRRREQDGRPDIAHWEVAAETRAGIVVVLTFALAIILGLGLAGLAGNLGVIITTLLQYLFGQAAWLWPITLGLFSLLYLRRLTGDFRLINALGLFLLMIGGVGLTQLVGTTGGGLLGSSLVSPLENLMGTPATGIVIAALIVIGLFLAFNASVGTLRLALEGARRVKAGISAWWLERRVARASAGRDLVAAQFQYQAVNLSAEQPNADEAAEVVAAEPADEPAITASRSASRPKKKVYGSVVLPIDLLLANNAKPTSGDIKANKIIIQRTLENFGVPVEMGDISVGPTVTQYTLKPHEGIKLSRITELHNDLALALAAHPIRIEAPIPGRSLVGIEVPNQSVALVRLRELFDSPEWRERESTLSIPLGKDVAGSVWVTALDRMPHLLVAGATGSGKSACLNIIITSLLYQNSPDTLRIILVDPKRVEFPIYNGVPHLLTPVITDVKKTINSLKWAILEMDRRFELLSNAKKRNIATYNDSAAEKLPYIVIIIDELADLMTTAPAEVEAAIIRLAQMARAVGIHLIVATQRPSVDVITGLIKANIPARLAFAVASQTDSRTILDQGGAEKLLGRGDMLFINAELSKPKRLQGAFINEQEVKNIVDYLANQLGQPEYNDQVVVKPTQPIPGINGHAVVGASDDGDELLAEAREVILQAGRASASLLQRRLKVGYARAARILDLLEAEGFIGPGDGAKPREVLAKRETAAGSFDSVVPERYDEEAAAPAEEAETEEGEETEGL